jgi:ketosteroid isomerase-like protein
MEATMQTFLKSYIAITLLLITSCSQNVDVNSEQQALLDADEAWAEAAASGDVEKIKAYWSEDAINYYPGQKPAFGKQEILEIVKRNRSIPGFKLSWEPRDAIVSKSGDLGYTHGSYKLSFNDPEGNILTRTGNYVCIWKKQDDNSWKCVMESSVPGPQT